MTRPDSPSRLLTLLQLCRAPNVFTAVADVAMGFLVVRQSLEPWPGFALVVIASCALYMAGMVLNDVYDVEVDRRERPARPIPSGRITLAGARRLGYGLLAGGMLAAGLAGLSSSVIWRSGVVGVALAACILLYDAVLKQTMAAPLLMGACRFWNVLLGMSVGGGVLGGPPMGMFTPVEWTLAAGIGVYIVGVTWFARTEAVESNRLVLAWGLTLMIAGIGLLAVAPRLATAALPTRIEPQLVWPAALCLLAVTVVRRCLVAIMDPQPARVQAAVKQSILSLIVLDASVCLLLCEWYWAVGVLALLVPTYLLGRRVYST